MSKYKILAQIDGHDADVAFDVISFKAFVPADMQGDPDTWTEAEAAEVDFDSMTIDSVDSNFDELSDNEQGALIAQLVDILEKEVR